MHLGTSIHDLTKRTGAQDTGHSSHTVDPFEDAHVIGIVFHQALLVLDGHLHLVGDLLVGIINLAFHIQDIASLIAGLPEDNIRSLIYKGEQPLDQMIYEPIFIQIIALLRRHIQNARRLHLSRGIGRDKLCVLAKMAHTVCRDLLGQRHRYDLLAVLDKPSRLVHDIENGLNALLHHGQPALIHHLVQDTVGLLQFVVAGLDHLKQVLKIPVIPQGLLDTARVFGI